MIESEGTGTQQVPCDSCGGVGYYVDLYLDVTELKTELDWIKKKIKVLLKKFDLPTE